MRHVAVDRVVCLVLFDDVENVLDRAVVDWELFGFREVVAIPVVKSCHSVGAFLEICAQVEDRDCSLEVVGVTRIASRRVCYRAVALAV